MPRTWENTNPGTPTEITVNINELSNDQQDQARLALRLWQDVANIHVTFIVGDDADITYIDDTKPDGKAEGSTYSFVDKNGHMTEAVVDLSQNFGVGPGKGNWNNFFQAMLHETGHALGLGHSGNYNGGKENEYYNTKSTLYANDTWQTSVMSYNDQAQHGASRDNVFTPQMADIYAMQKMYGAATTRTEDSVYGFNCNIIDPDANPDAKYQSVYDLDQYSVRRLGHRAPAFTIYDSAGNDTLDVSGYKVDQTIDLTPGHFSSVGGYKENVGIYNTVTVENAVGGAGNDLMTGNAAVNHLFGGDGNDTLDGGSGGDSMVGGMGDDTYVVDSADDDTVEFGDVGSGIDTVKTNLSFYRLDSNVENLVYTSDQAFSGIGNELDNSIAGGIGDDFLQGNDGNDTLIGNGGRDSMIGGVGDDIYVINDTSAVIVEWDGEGIDEVQTAGRNYTLGFAVENLRFTENHSFRHRGFGNSLDNYIYGGSNSRDFLSGAGGNDHLYGYDGPDILSGDDGNDILKGGSGSDTLDGGDGIDTADYRDAVAKTKIDLADGTADVLRSDGTETDSLISIENVIASTRDDFIVGDGHNNTFTYAGYYQSLSASGGVDKYFGGLGSDTVDFSIFSVQTLEVDLRAGTATAKYSVDGPHGTKNGVKVIAQLSGIENVVASTRNTTIIGDDENNTFTYVGAFGDQVDKGGRDDYDGGKGSDTIDLSRLATQMVRLDLGVGDVEASYHIGLPGDNVLAGSAVVAHISNIENIVASFGDDTLSGDDNDNSFTYVGGFFFDVKNASYDTYAGGEGVDTVDFSRFYGNALVDLSTGDMSSSFTVLFPNGETSRGSTVLGRVSGVENVVAGMYDDTITGDDKDNTFFYTGSVALEEHVGGQDSYDGGAGVNTLDLSKASASLGAIVDLENGLLSSRGYDNFGNVHTNQYATLQNIQNAVGTGLRDTFRGSAIGNVFSGRGGDDRLIGAGGDDQLTGGTGKDTFVFGVGFGDDAITDFRVADNKRFGISHDVIEFSKSVFVDWDHVLAVTSDSDAGAVIALESGDAITLTGVTRQQLIDHHAADFSFV